MQQRGFRITHSPDEQHEYFEHVGLKDKWKAEKYRQCYPRDVLRKNRSNMFVKTGESHSVIFSKTGENNRDDLKPRLINCPDFAIRARVGLVSYFTLKFMKQEFPEFFLAKTPQMLEEDLKLMEEYEHTY